MDMDIGSSVNKSGPSTGSLSDSTSASGSKAKATGPQAGLPDKPSTNPVNHVDYITELLDQLTTDAANLPSKSDLKFHRTLDRSFAKDLDGASKSVLELTDALVSLVNRDRRAGYPVSSGKGKGRQVKEEEDVTEDFRRTVGEALDTILEDADAKLDEASGAIKAAKVKVDPAKAASAGEKLPGPFAANAAISKGRLPTSMTNADVGKPQLLFLDPVDNTPNRIWTPTLPEKVHAMVPLSYVAPTLPPLTEEESYDDKIRERRRKEDRRRMHPYWFETEHLPYPTRMFEVAPPIEPLGLNESEATFVDTPEGLQAMTEELKNAKEIAMDLEYHSARSYYGFTCLMQISTREKDWVVDTLKLRGELREHKLGGVMADPSIIKVFHGAGSDVVWLQQDFDIYIVNLFDTFWASKALGFPTHSLAALLARYANFTADKRYQMADWRLRPLPKEMLDYARSDTHFLLNIYDKLRNALLEMASRPPSPSPVPGANGTVAPEIQRRTPETNPQRALRGVLELSAETALQVYQRDDYNPATGKGSAGWKQARRKVFDRNLITQIQGLVFVRLHQWRDRLARELDESPHYIMYSNMINTIAMMPLPTVQRIQATLLKTYTGPIGAGNRAAEILDIVKQARLEYATLTQDRKMSLSGVSDPQLAWLGNSAKKGDGGEAADVVMEGAIAAPQAAHGSTKAASAFVLPVNHTTTSNMPVFQDLWDGFKASEARAPVSTNGKKSALFGSAILNTNENAKTAASKPAAAPPRKAKSALFGKIISKPTTGQTSNATSAKANSNANEANDFASVSRDIAMSIGSGLGAPSTSLSVDSATAARPATTLTLPEFPMVQESGTPKGRLGIDQLRAVASAGKARMNSVDASVAIPTPHDDSMTTSSPAPASSPAPTSASPAPVAQATSKAKKPKDEIVQVKRKKGKPAKAVSSAQASASPASASGSGAPSNDTATITANANANASAPAKKKKKPTGRTPQPPAKAEDVPMYDYSLQPDFLTETRPKAGPSAEDVKKSRKAKKKAKANGPPASSIETPDFGPRPKDMTQPRAGPRSQTFTS